MNTKKCENCGVILEPDMKFCPLCGHGTHQEHVPQQKEKKLQRKGLLWELFSIIMGAAALIILVSDYAGERQLEWSAIPVGCLVYLWLILTFIHFFGQNHLYIMSFFNYLSTLGLLFLIDYMDGEHNWAFALGIPIATVASLSFIAGTATLRQCKIPGLQLLGHWFVILAIVPLVLESIISLYAGNFHLSWSLIAAISLIPAALLFYYLHYRAKLWIDLRNYFHF